MRKFRTKPIAALIGSAFVASIASASFADTGANPFGAQELAKGYDLLADPQVAAEDGEGKDAEGKCGEGKDAEGKCGEGKCGEGKCGEDTGGEGPDAEGASEEVKS